MRGNPREKSGREIRGGQDIEQDISDPQGGLGEETAH